MIALAIALREHTALQEFRLIDCSRHGTMEAVQGASHTRTVSIMIDFASSAYRCHEKSATVLAQLHPATELRLVLKTEPWLAVTNEIQCGLVHWLSAYVFLAHFSVCTS
jgi:hypothetical protein